MTNHSENETAKAIAPAGEIVDVDSSSHFGSGFIKVESLAAVKQRSTHHSRKSASVASSSFMLNDDSTVVIGSIDGTLNGINNTALQVNLNNNATWLRAACCAFAYHNTSDDRSSVDADNNCSIRITVNDGGSTSELIPSAK